MNNKKTFVLLRGLARQHRHWGEFLFQLQATFPEAEILTPDLPGNGDNNLMSSPLSITESLEVVRHQLRNKYNTPFYIIALSLGGMVAMEWASRYPGECAGVVLMNSSFKGLSPFYQRLRPANYGRIVQVLVSLSPLYQECQILGMTSIRHYKNRPLLEQWLSYARAHPVKRINIIRQIIAASRYRLPLQKPPVSMLILSSRQDRLVNPACSQALAEHWQLPHMIHSESGHDLALDEGQWVCQQISDWCD